MKHARDTEQHEQLQLRTKFLVNAWYKCVSSITILYILQHAHVNYNIKLLLIISYQAHNNYCIWLIPAKF